MSTELTQQYLMRLIRDMPEGAKPWIIQPELAKFILDQLNEKNRDKRASTIRTLVDHINERYYLLTGAPIIFSVSGVLLDGQNRLEACFRSGVPITSYIVFGIVDEAFDVIDTGKGRTKGDTLKVLGVSYYNETASALRWLMIYRDAPPMDRGVVILNHDVKKFWLNDVDQDSIKSFIVQARDVKSKSLPNGVLAAHLYLFDKINATATQRMINDLRERKRAGGKLIKRLDGIKVNKSGRLHELERTAMIVQTWISYRDGQPLTKFGWVRGEDYPEIGMTKNVTQLQA